MQKKNQLIASSQYQESFLSETNSQETFQDAKAWFCALKKTIGKMVFQVENLTSVVGDRFSNYYLLPRIERTILLQLQKL